MRFEIVRYEPGFKSQVLELQRGLWGDDVGRNAAYFEWKYERNPYLEDPFVHLALADGRVVGMRGMYGAHWEAGDPPRTFLAPCAGDLVVAPEYRNHGLANTIIETAVSDLADNGYSYAFSFSAGLQTQLASLMTGWRSAGSVEVARWSSARQRILGRFKAYARRVPLAREAARRLASPRRFAVQIRQLAAGQRSFDRLDRRGARDDGDGAPIRVEHAPRPEAMAELLERSRGDGRLRHARDAGYFAWRFSNPLRAYRFLYWGDTRLEGYLVLQAAAPGLLAPLSIVDWEATDPMIGADLLRAAIRWGGFPDLTTWSATLPAETKSTLRETGFTVLTGPNSLGRAHRTGEYRSILLARALRPEAPGQDDWIVAGRRLLDLEHWDLRMIYSDFY